MGKAIEGAAMLAGAAVIGAGMLFPGTAEFFNNPFFYKALEGLVIGGLSMELGAIAGALTSNRGQNITTRQAAGFRQVIYGTQRVGGTILYKSTTGSNRDQYNFVIAIDTHLSSGIVGLYLDGRLVHFNFGIGTMTRNGVTFGGSADSGTYTGPDGTPYNFGGKVYCEACYGDQTSQPNTVPGGGFNTGLQANDPAWGPSAAGSPYVGGCTYVYLKIENDPATFPGEPEIRFTVMGKPVFDPRTQTTGYSHNWALICNDILTDPLFGIEEQVNQAQLIAAANVCDEQTPLAAGSTEDRYAAHGHFDTSVGAGDVLNTIMSAASGRASFIGGEWYLWPAYFQGAAASFDASHLTSPPQWSETRSTRDLFNRVTGTYTAPNYPYNPAGNLYDANGWYEGQVQNNFQFAYQPTNFPQYAQDAGHGYPSDQFFTEDGNTPLPKDLNLSWVLSVAQAQRLAKIELLRNRFQGTGSWNMTLAAYQLQPCDTLLQTFPANGWSNKLLEVNSVQFRIEQGGGAEPPQIVVAFGFNETDPSVYEWSTLEEQTVYAVPAGAQQAPYMPAAPTDLTLDSSAATAVVGFDGVARPRVLVGWNTPLDGLVTGIQIQYQAHDPNGPSLNIWTDAGLADVGNNAAYVSGVVAGGSYLFRIRSVRANGATSPWLESSAYTVSLTLSSITSTGLNPNSPYNTSNTATVDSIVENSAATIRLYGPGGDGSTFLRYQGATTSAMNAAHITGNQFTTAYYVVFDTVGLAYLAFTNYNQTLADQYIFIGQVNTCAATYTGTGGGTGGGGTGTGGGSSGGGGGTPGGGRNPIVAQPGSNVN